ncbi:hypothetical protein SDC9_184959 [bioreactor metagenome]|uniref:Uncharacterized protein n=1 Tax=bioreactor metagenome TaxID=1076179 RepID=A0A645HEJ8_9ZZZZ
MRGVVFFMAAFGVHHDDTDVIGGTGLRQPISDPRFLGQGTRPVADSQVDAAAFHDLGTFRGTLRNYDIGDIIVTFLAGSIAYG